MSRESDWTSENPRSAWREEARKRRRPLDVVVIGAGVIGMTIAFRLAQMGRKVHVLERDGVAAGASRGNAGAYAYADIQPLASPGIWRQVPRWLADPLGPLSISPAYLSTIAPWLWRFWRASQPDKVAAGTRAQAALMRLAAAATPRLLEAIDARWMLHEEGNLHLYESEAQWKAALPGWQVRADHGVAFQHVQGADAIAQWQPGLSPDLEFATLVPGWATIDDPLRLVQRIAWCAARAGARLRHAQVVSLRAGSDAVSVRLAGGKNLRARHVVVAAGAWSHQLARTIGEQIPLETERGYNTTLPAGAFALRRQLTFPDHGFVITPIDGGVRVGGAVELAGLEAPPNYRRAEVLLEKARRFLPKLRAEGGTQWMGFRPSLPDSLPVIGPSAVDPRIIYAFGHGHLGLTQSAATAELVRSLFLEQETEVDLQPFAAKRFAK